MRTPGPWEMHDEGPEVEGPRFTIDADDSRGPWLVARVTRPDDAAFIVRAVNAHDELVDALKDALETLTYVKYFEKTGLSALEDCEEAIKETRQELDREV